VKRSLLTDGNGLPLALVAAPANRHDIKLVADTLDALETDKPSQPLRLCLDKGYEAAWLKALLPSLGYEPYIQSRKEESDASKEDTEFKCHRWVVERTHSWLNRYRRLLVRWEKKIENYEAMLHFACGMIVWNKCLLR
jgi:transposase